MSHDNIYSMNQTKKDIIHCCEQIIEIQIAIAYIELSQDWKIDLDKSKIDFYKNQFFKLDTNIYLTESANLMNKKQTQTQILEIEMNKFILSIQSNFDIESKRELLKLLFQSMHQVLSIEETQDSKLINKYFERFSFFRSFDFIDEIIGINYSPDINQKSIPMQKERLYEGAGVGVQSSYSTLFQIYKNVDLFQNASVIDLGSGYGRLGFYLNILRPDIHFTGYEFLDCRVNQANENLKNIFSSNNSQFLTQDLSKTDFKLPDADFYYLYDPFTDSTYQLIMDQLVEISRRKNITIISKGNSKIWLRSIEEKMIDYHIRSIDNDHIVIVEKQTA